jgi:hypothetical protein
MRTTARRAISCAAACLTTSEKATRASQMSPTCSTASPPSARTSSLRENKIPRPRENSDVIRSWAARQTCICHSLDNAAVSEYKITVARIETAARGAHGKEICVTSQVERTPISFQIPIFLNTHDFDDTEMIQVARNALHRTFMQLAAESRDWKLITAELQRLSKVNFRPTKRPA